MTLITPDPVTATGPTSSAAIRATIQVLTDPGFTGQKHVLLGLVEEQLWDLPPIEVMTLRDDVFLWMADARIAQRDGLEPKHNPRTLHQVMMMLN